MATTSTIRTWWHPPCTTHGAVLVEAYQALNACLRRYNYAPRSQDTGAFNCRRITGGSGYSLHAYAPGPAFTFWSGARVTTALAVDINWNTNPYGRVLITDMPREMIAAIKGVRTNSGAQVWRWGGDYSGNKDAMHFEIVCTPSALRSGINPRTVPSSSTPTPTPTPAPTPAPIDMERFVDWTSLILAAFHAKHPGGLTAEHKAKVWFWGDVLVGKAVRGEDAWGGYQWIKANEPAIK